MVSAASGSTAYSDHMVDRRSSRREARARRPSELSQNKYTKNLRDTEERKPTYLDPDRRAREPLHTHTYPILQPNPKPQHRPQTSERRHKRPQAGSGRSELPSQAPEARWTFFVKQGKWEPSNETDRKQKAWQNPAWNISVSAGSRSMAYLDRNISALLTIYTRISTKPKRKTTY